MQARWESETRYYAVVLQQDLFGDWVLTTARGGKRNRLGGVRHLVVSTKEEGLKKIQALHRLRLRHGYQLTSSDSVSLTRPSV